MSNGGGISKQTFECYVCKKNGFPNERVYLAGKDPNNKTIYISEDGVTAHRHKFKESGGANTTKPVQTDTTTAQTIISLLKDIAGKLNRLLAIEGQ